MSTALRAKPITAKEFEKFDPDWRYDLIKGELYPMPPMPGQEHGEITMDFGAEATVFVRDHRLGKCFAAETRFIIERDPDTVIAPDWAFVAKDRLPRPRVQGFVPVVPDAVLEVRSPSDRASKVEEKINLWLASGVRIAWELDTKKRTLTVYRPGTSPKVLGIDDTLSGEDVLPGFSLAVRTLFEE